MDSLGVARPSKKRPRLREEMSWEVVGKRLVRNVTREKGEVDEERRKSNERNDSRKSDGFRRGERDRIDSLKLK